MKEEKKQRENENKEEGKRRSKKRFRGENDDFFFLPNGTDFHRYLWRSSALTRLTLIYLLSVWNAAN